ncbi:type II toxin-antitoxin system RelE/ParE family toxin [Enterovirga rhinocerotis]|uniref:Plasmid stabilization system protein ParE n=1 Tax=Enterovirga rhinocerotis TaxID=1339210 RepID=A0A4R7CA84_9HYPH|nr:type II toxin-antitoxin system RelE/ParE family toxin [Enterovirga rhinocerotis]TDR93707.1 plasmid stabilization system protein ParE [Enterovirga rhinocerotis]
MKVRTSSAARRDLRDIVDFIGRDNPMAARRLKSNLLKRLASLSEHPARGRVVAEHDGIALRRLIEGSFLIFYLVRQEDVLVTRVMRGSRAIDVELLRDPGWPEEPV